jgi:hypothetical protein
MNTVKKTFFKLLDLAIFIIKFSIIAIIIGIFVSIYIIEYNKRNYLSCYKLNYMSNGNFEDFNDVFFLIKHFFLL